MMAHPDKAGSSNAVDSPALNAPATVKAKAPAKAKAKPAKRKHKTSTPRATSAGCPRCGKAGKLTATSNGTQDFIHQATGAATCQDER